MPSASTLNDPSKGAITEATKKKAPSALGNPRNIPGWEKLET